MAQIQLVGTAANRDAIGTTITMEHGDLKFVEQIIGGGSYLSSSQRVVLVPCDSTTEGPQSTMKVIWPGGRVTECVRPDSAGRYVLIEPASENATARLHQLPE